MNISIVAEGGGVRGAYVCGVMCALWMEYGLRRVDVATGTSASAGTLAYFTAGHGHRDAWDVWTKEVASPEFISVRNLLRLRPLMDLDHLIDVVFRYRYPLDVAAIKRSSMRLFIPVESVTTGKIEYIDAQRSPYDVFEILKASSAAPIAYNKTIALGGDRYCDPYFNEAVPLGAPALARTKKIIILAKPRTHELAVESNVAIHLGRPFISSAVYRTMLHSGKHRNALMEQCKTLEEEGHIVIAPEHLYGSALGNRPESLRYMIRRGYQDAVAHGPLRALVEDLCRSPKRSAYFDSDNLAPIRPSFMDTV
ncbi:patatin-like phospholipase family protein [Candidatus Kaiserbacteria bacterium]|nr:patatin-like phospholipase family protein [Candidatus Kaiserbacteria bacterium]